MPDDKPVAVPALPVGKAEIWVEGVEPDPTTPKVNARKSQPPLYTDGQKSLKRLQKT